MEFIYVSLLTFLVLLVSLFLHFFLYKNKFFGATSSLPPGSTGWRMLRENLDFLFTCWRGHPEKFIFDRIAKYSSNIFRINILAEPIIVFCGAKENKFLFSNEKKLVQMSMPNIFDKLLLPSAETSIVEEASKLRKILPIFFRAEGLQWFIGIMDEIAQRHFADCWENQQEILTYPLVRKFIFSSGYRLFINIEDPNQFNKFFEQFQIISAGLLSVPINIPGTRFNKARKASNFAREQLISMIKQRRMELVEGKASPTQDILSLMVLTTEDNGELTPESNIASRILLLLLASNDTSSATCTSIVYYLADFPEIYERVYVEQMEIANSKEPGELLNWNDVQKMKYSWNVACETLRLAPPALGGFKEAITDFTYNGFSIPKGWKIHWNVYPTHQNPEYFPEPKKFDPSRFEGSGPPPYTFVPFGGGLHMCPGKEYEKLIILAFMHNLVKRFKFEKVIHDEKITVNPMSYPAEGLPLRIYPHKK